MITKSSGDMERYDTGAVRDLGADKPTFDDIPLYVWDSLGGVGFEAFDTDEEFQFNITEHPDIEYMPDYPKERFQALMARGARKYGEHNWMLGIPLDRYFNSAMRHLLQWRFGDKSEGHLEAVMFNVMAAMETEKNIAEGKLSEDLVRDVGVLR